MPASFTVNPANIDLTVTKGVDTAMTNLESAFTSPLDKLAKSVSVPKVKNALDGKRNSAKLVSNELFSTKLYPIGEDITMRKVATVGVTLLAALTLTACGSSGSSSSSTPSKNATSSSKKAEPKNAITMTKYNSIKVGDPSTGVGGTAEKTVTSMYGKPLSETETTVPGAKMKAKDYTWSNVGSSLQGASVTAEFLNGKAVGKGYADFGKSTKISNGDYKSVQTGASFTTVRKQFGAPQSESIVGGSGITSAQTLTYVNTNGSKSLSFTFSNNKLMSKTATSLN